MIADDKTSRLLDNRLKDEFYYRSIKRYQERNRGHFLFSAMSSFITLVFIFFAGENMRSIYILVALFVTVIILTYSFWFYLHGKKVHRVTMVEMEKTLLDYQIRFSQQGLNTLELNRKAVSEYKERGIIKSELEYLGFAGLKGKIIPTRVYNLKHPNYYQVGKKYQIKPLFRYDAFGFLTFFAYDIQKVEPVTINKIKKLDYEKDSV